MQSAAGISKDNTPLAVVVIVLTVFALSLGDALIKLTSVGLVLWQIFVLRSLMAVPVLLAAWTFRFRHVPLRPVSIGWSFLRSFMLAVMWVVYYASLPHLEFSIAAASYYTLPIFITLFSAFLVGEKVSRLGWVAVLLGFSGVALILRPTANQFNAYALLPIISAILYALSMILTRTKCQQEHPLILAIVLNIAFILVGLAGPVLLPTFDAPFLSEKWVHIGAAEALAFGLFTIIILIGGVGTAIAYQYGRSFVVSTFDFAYVGFAVIWGILFFNEIPDLVTISGILMIVGAGTLAVRK
ncbi:DMT family transporter [Ruegeria meonggei]|uniref:EamA-like transporter family protein n=1 Tax=Ruegeria meonggei TaxID=1446476 RepID=A0A1X6YXB8_9RHOB|nr:DMT family transporter [Ruegeria meonggei]SLN33561.1 EamA-like transporter family protein [Ruegeria meonggei]